MPVMGIIPLQEQEHILLSSIETAKAFLRKNGKPVVSQELSTLPDSELIPKRILKLQTQFALLTDVINANIPVGPAEPNWKEVLYFTTQLRLRDDEE